MFDGVYFINLAHRTDRRTEIESELEKFNWLGISARVEAIRMPECGAAGCLISHCAALRMFLADPAKRHALILEDDCSFKEEAPARIAEFLREHLPQDWDVLMLAACIIKCEPYRPYATKILNAQTASAYAVTRPFAACLLSFWEQTTPLFNVRDVWNPQCDMTWKILQPHQKWYCLEPTVAAQRPSWSDIENKHANYGV